MNNEKQRLLLIVLFMFGWVLLLQSLGSCPASRTSPRRRPRRPFKSRRAAGTPQAKDAELAKAEAKPAEEPDKTAEAEKDKPRSAEGRAGRPQEPGPGLGHRQDARTATGSRSSSTRRAPASSRCSPRDTTPSSRGEHNPHRPLQLIRRDPVWPASLSLTLSPDPLAGERAKPGPETPEASSMTRNRPSGSLESEDLLDAVLWDVVRDEAGQVVHPLSAVDPGHGQDAPGPGVVFRTTAGNGVIVTKTFRLWQTMNGFELELRFESPDKDRTFSYNLLGPHGIPIEGEWYTGTFREVFFGTYRRTGENQGSIKVDAHTAERRRQGHGRRARRSTARPSRSG